MFNPVVDPEFLVLLPKHTKDELAQLEESVLADPNHELMPKVILWPTPDGDVVVDGNNQHALRQKNGLAIKYVAKDFPDRTAAMRFALDVQFGRRNVDASKRAFAYAKLERVSNGGDRRSDQSANLQTEKTMEDLAKMAGVSSRTMASAVKVADNAAPAIEDGVRDGNFKVSDAARVVCLPKPIQERLAAKAMLGGTTLRKAAEPSGGTSFESEELEIASAVAAAKPRKNGASVVDGKLCEQTRTKLSALCRQMKSLGLFDKHKASLSEMIRDVDALRKPVPPRFAT
jgi:hypothetical protein